MKISYQPYSNNYDKVKKAINKDFENNLDNINNYLEYPSNNSVNLLSLSQISSTNEPQFKTIQ